MGQVKLCLSWFDIRKLMFDKMVLKPSNLPSLNLQICISMTPTSYSQVTFMGIKWV